MEIERPLAEKEVKILDKKIEQLNKRFKRYIRFLLIYTILAVFIGSIVYFKMNTTVDIIFLIVVVFVYIGIGIWTVGEAYFKHQQERRTIAFLKQKNVLTVIKVLSNKYYELVEEDDEGTYYLFQIENNKIFSFGGQDFYPSQKFPSDNFEIVVGRGIKNEVILLEILNYGKKLNPIKKILSQDKWSLLNSLNYPDPHKLTLVNGKLEDFH